MTSQFRDGPGTGMRPGLSGLSLRLNPSVLRFFSVFCLGLEKSSVTSQFRDGPGTEMRPGLSGLCLRLSPSVLRFFFRFLSGS